jgi:hypothetical protein
MHIVNSLAARLPLAATRQAATWLPAQSIRAGTPGSCHATYQRVQREGLQKALRHCEGVGGGLGSGHGVRQQRLEARRVVDQPGGQFVQLPLRCAELGLQGCVAGADMAAMSRAGCHWQVATICQR